MPRGDAVQSVPTVADEMAKFQGFTTSDGDTVDSATSSKEEEAAAVQRDKADETAKFAVKRSSGTAASNTENEGVEGEETEENTGINTENTAAQEDDTKMVSMAEVKKMMAKAASKRIGEVKKQSREAIAVEKQRAATLEARLLAALEGKPLTGEVKDSKPDPDIEPKPADFEYGELDARYIRALARFEARQEFKAGQDNQQKARLSDAAAQEAQKFEERKSALEEAGSAKYDDFQEVVIESAMNGEWPLSKELGQLALESKVGHDILYYLASDPKESRRVASLSPYQQAAYFGRLEARFSSDEDANPKQEIRVPKAPAPITNARGRGGKGQVSPDTSDFKSFEALAMHRR
jgi:hypothetical protein